MGKKIRKNSKITHKNQQTKFFFHMKQQQQKLKQRTITKKQRHPEKTLRKSKTESLNFELNIRLLIPSNINRN